MKKEKTLKDLLREVADLYAKETEKIIGCQFDCFVAENMGIETASFGEFYFLSLGEMQQIVDHMPKWVEKYGSREKVGKVVRGWFDCCLEHSDEYDSPRINLWSWLLGLRWGDIKDEPNPFE